MGKLVNVVLPDGKVVSVPEEAVTRVQGMHAGKIEGDQGAAARSVDASNKERASGIGQGVKAAVEGAADALSGGIVGKVASHGDADYAAELQNRGQNRPGARMAGELGAFLAPTGWLGGGAKAVGEASVLGGAAGLGRAVEGVAGKAAGRIAEGAVIGVGSHVAQSNVTGDPLTIEGIAESAGIGGLLNHGMGVVADKFTKVGAKAVARQAEEAAVTEKVTRAQKADKLFKSDSPAYSSFKAAVDSSQGVEKEFAAQSEKAVNNYVAATKPDAIAGTINDFEKTRNEVLTRIQKSPATAENAAAEAEYHAAVKDSDKAYARDTELHQRAVAKHDKYATSKKFGNDLTEIQAKLKKIRNRWAPEGVEDLHTLQTEGHRVELGAEGEVEKAKAWRSARSKPPISPETAEEIRALNDELSDVYKTRGAGYKKGSGRFDKDAAEAANPAAAVEKARALRDKLAAKYPGTPWPDIPTPPTAPVRPPPPARAPRAGGTVAPGGDVDLAHVARDIDTSLERARDAVRKTDYEAALEHLEGVGDRARAAGVVDVEFPKVAPRPLNPLHQPQGVKLPKDLRDLISMKEPTIARLQERVASDPAIAGEFEKLAGEIGVSPLDGVAGVHRQLGEYVSALDGVEALKAAGGDGFTGLLRKLAKGAAVNGAGMGAYIAGGGGISGAIAGGLARTGVRNWMTGIESAELGAGVMAARTGLGSKVTSLVGEYGGKAGVGISRIAPVTSYLGAQFPSGTPDPETDPRKRAVNRIRDVHNAALIAPDAMFSAVQPLLGHPADIGGKLHQQAMNALTYLSAVAPKDPGINTRMGSSAWTPSYEQTTAFASAFGAVTDPMGTVQRALQGRLHPAGVDALWQVWPAMMHELANQLMADPERLAKLSQEETSRYSRLFRTPLSGLQKPEVVLALQGMYMETAPQAPGGGGQHAPSGQPVGRPAAVQSQVAGSSPAALQSQA